MRSRPSRTRTIGLAATAGGWIRVMALAVCLWADGARALDFQFTCASVAPGSGGSGPTVTTLANCNSFNSQALQGFQQAAQSWSSRFTDPFTVNLRIGFGAIGNGLLGGADPTEAITSYSDFYSAISQDRRSANDFLAVGSLPLGSSIGLAVNYTNDNPFGVGSAVPYVDNDGGFNNSNIVASTANFKALGFDINYALSNPFDATILFTDFSDFSSGGFSWDFAPANGISASQVDFVGVATHEIGHALGFLSAADIVDAYSTGPTFYSENQIAYARPLDLFRYSAESKASSVIDVSADTRAKYFSIDGGVTSLAAFSTGQLRGDGREDSHWKDNALTGTYLGLMDPTLSTGSPLSFTSLDLLAFDVIGYDRAVPGPLPLLGGAAAFGWSRRLRKRVNHRRSQVRASHGKTAQGRTPPPT